MGMDPLIWGPSIWGWLLTLNYECYCESNRDHILQILIALKDCLPCSHCRSSYKSYCRTLPPDKALTSDVDSGLRWVWMMHDMVNQKLGKPCLAYSKLKQRLQSNTINCEDSSVQGAAFLLYPEEVQTSPHVQEAVITVVRSLRNIHARTQSAGSAWSAGAPLVSVDDAERVVYDAFNNIETRNGRTKMSMTQFRNKFMQARVPKKKPSKESQTSPRVR